MEFDSLLILNLALVTVFILSCGFRIMYSLVRLLGLKKHYEATRLCRYAILIAARNEEGVVGHLIESIKAQDYPSELVDIYVVADNCTDSTAKVAEKSGATVYERCEPNVVGKGHALAFLLDRIKENHGDVHYDGFFVFDADNLLDHNYIKEINKLFTNGFPVVTGYRNTKNFGANWVSYGYGIYFVFESEHTNRARSYLHSGSFVSGTGYVFSSELLEELGGWNYFSLSEDFEFTADMISRCKKIGYSPDAILYDEQPTSFKNSIYQRSRWIKGFFQMFMRFSGKMSKAMITKGSFAAYDMLMYLASILAGALTMVRFITLFWPDKDIHILIMCLVQFLASTYLGCYVMGLVTIITEHKKIVCPKWKLILYSFTFPIFIYSFALVFIHAAFSRPQWKPVPHSASLTIDEIEEQKKRET